MAPGRSLRTRDRNVDYSGRHNPSTPGWLKLGIKSTGNLDHGENDDVEDEAKNAASMPNVDVAPANNLRDKQLKKNRESDPGPANIQDETQLKDANIEASARFRNHRSKSAPIPHIQLPEFNSAKDTNTEEAPGKEKQSKRSKASKLENGGHLKKRRQSDREEACQGEEAHQETVVVQTHATQDSSKEKKRKTASSADMPKPQNQETEILKQTSSHHAPEEQQKPSQKSRQTTTKAPAQQLEPASKPASKQPASEIQPAATDKSKSSLLASAANKGDEGKEEQVRATSGSKQQQQQPEMQKARKSDAKSNAASALHPAQPESNTDGHKKEQQQAPPQVQQPASSQVRAAAAAEKQSQAQAEGSKVSTAGGSKAGQQQQPSRRKAATGAATGAGNTAAGATSHAAIARIGGGAAGPANLGGQAAAGPSSRAPALESSAPADAAPGCSDAELGDVERLLQPGAGSDPAAFAMLQDQYIRLQELYQQLKAQKIQELESLLEEQDEYVDMFNTSVTKLADHWRAEAEKQVELAKKAGTAEAAARLEHLEEEVLALQGERADLQAQVLELLKAAAEREARVSEAQAQATEVRAAMQHAKSVQQQAQEAREAMLAQLKEAQARLEEMEGQLEAARQAEQEAKMSMAQQQVQQASPAVAYTPMMLAHGLHNIALQYPTPAMPSPGVGTQFPSPAMLPGIGLQFLSPMRDSGAFPNTALKPSASKQKRSAATSPGLSHDSVPQPMALPPASALRRAQALSASGPAAHSAGRGDGSGLAVVLEAGERTPAAGAAAGRASKDSGSPVEGLFAQDAQGEAQDKAAGGSVHEVMARSLLPEGLDDLDMSYVQQQQAKSPSLKPSSQHASMQQQQQAQKPLSARTSSLDNHAQVQPAMQQAPLHPQGSSQQLHAAGQLPPASQAAAASQGAQHMDIDLDPRSAMKGRRTPLRALVQQAAAVPLPSGSPARPSPLSRGMQQLLESTKAATAALQQQQTRSTYSNMAVQHAPAMPAASAPAGLAGLAGAAAHAAAADGAAVAVEATEGSNQLSCNMPGATCGTAAKALASGSRAAADEPMTAKRLHLPGVEQEAMLADQEGAAPPHLSTPKMTPYTAKAYDAVSMFFGFKVLPLQQDKWFEYIHPVTGLRFHIGPCTDLDDSELEDSGLVEEGVVPGPVLTYRPLVLGTAKLPSHLQEEIYIPEAFKSVFVNQLWSAVYLSVGGAM